MRALCGEGGWGSRDSMSAYIPGFAGSLVSEIHSKVETTAEFDLVRVTSREAQREPSIRNRYRRSYKSRDGFATPLEGKDLLESIIYTKSQSWDISKTRSSRSRRIYPRQARHSLLQSDGTRPTRCRYVSNLNAGPESVPPTKYR